ncbi:MAG TPA: type II toxin-antitoxin system HicA family toxin [Pirellulales bacterium]|nr:type II toxin-antitoxin system HicA family toxin [Pirellulales bacterium]
MAGATVRFADVRKMLEGAGYALVRIRGSHHVFAKPERLPVSIPVHRGKVKAFYVRQIEKLIAGDRP